MDAKDEQWKQAYKCVLLQKYFFRMYSLSNFSKILNKPTHKCSWAETKSVFRSEAGWPHFSAVFFVSAETSEGVDALRVHLQELSSKGEWRFDRNVQTAKVSEPLPAFFDSNANKQNFLAATKCY